MSTPRIPLHHKILLGLAIGTFGGAAASFLWPGAPALDWTVRYVARPVGQIFLRMLLMVVVPLIFTTLVLGVTGLGDLKRLGRMGAKSLIFFFVTTAGAAIFGLIIVNVLRPGDVISPDLRRTLVETFSTEADAIVGVAGSDLSISTFVNIVPSNPITAAAQGDLLAVIFFTLVFGIAMTRLPKEFAEPLVRFLEALARTILVMVGFAMKLAPVGVAALTFAVTAQFGFDILAPLALYTAAVLGGLVLHQFGVLALIAKGLGGVQLRSFYRAIRFPMLTAFSTASSSATLPTTIRAAEQGLGVPREVSGFVLPLGATLNMNGTALFEGVTILFLAQAFGIELGLATQGLVVVMAVLTAISAAGIPSGSIPLIVVILMSVGVPGEAIALIMGVEPLLGMARTSTNVTGDLVASVVVTRSEGMRLTNIGK